MINYIFNGKATTILLTVGLIKKISLYRMRYLPEPHTHSKNKIEDELDFSNYYLLKKLRNI